jgi:hypothetical protein
MKNTNDLTDDPFHKACTGTNCDFAIDTELEAGLCLSGAGTCLSGGLLEAESSGFHDEALIEATRKIRQILSDIPPDRDGRQLSFLVTGMGILLAWTSHGESIPENSVTAGDDDATVAKALKLTNWETPASRS